MTVKAESLTDFVERTVDSDRSVSLREFLSKVYVRPRLFWICVLLPPLLAMGLTALVPPEWQATAKILIRYSSSESPFLQGLIPGDRVALSGGSSAELLKSIPALAATVQRQHIEPGDIYRKPSDVLSGYVSAALGHLIPSDPGPSLPGIDAQTLATATAFGKSLESKGGFGTGGSSKGGVEVLERYAQLPETMKGDELIEVTVPSFNRKKVADMTNGLAQAFIDEYYRVSAEDAHRAYEFLSTLVANAEQDLARGNSAATPLSAESGKEAPVSATDIARPDGGNQQIYQASPVLEGIARELADRKASLARLRQIYSADAPEVIQASRQVESLEQTLGNTHTVEVGKQTLEQLKARRYQAYNTELLYRNHLVPISIIQPALTPKGSVAKYVVRVLVAGVVGLVLGLVLGVALVVILAMLDQRLFTSWDVERQLGLPMLGWLPERASPGGRNNDPAEVTADVEDGLLQILGRLDTASPAGGGRVVLLSSAAAGDGKTFVALHLAAALARGGRTRVLLVDADLADQGLTLHFGQRQPPGLVDAILAGEITEGSLRKSSIDGVDLLPTGDVSRRSALGFYRKTLKSLLEGLRSRYDLILIDSPAMLSGNEALLCSMAADSVVLVARAGATRQPALREACRKLGEVGVLPQGLILNRRQKLLPDWLYNRV